VAFDGMSATRKWIPPQTTIRAANLFEAKDAALEGDGKDITHVSFGHGVGAIIRAKLSAVERQSPCSRFPPLSNLKLLAGKFTIPQAPQ
jgi:hypothetical protein